MAFASPRVSRVEHGLSLLPSLEERWCLDLYPALSLPPSSTASRSGRLSLSRDYGRSVGKDHRTRRHSRIRCAQARERPQAASRLGGEGIPLFTTVQRRRRRRKSALGLLSCFPFRLIWRTVAHMSKVFKVSRNFTIRGAKLIHADSAEQAIAIATAEDHPEFFEGRLGSNIGHDVWTHVGRVSSDNEDLRAEEVS